MGASPSVSSSSSVVGRRRSSASGGADKQNVHNQKTRHPATAAPPGTREARAQTRARKVLLSGPMKRARCCAIHWLHVDFVGIISQIWILEANNWKEVSFKVGSLCSDSTRLGDVTGWFQLLVYSSWAHKCHS